MEKARVMVFEDDPIFRKLIKKILGTKKHEFTAEASCIDSAFETLDKVSQGEIDCDVLILDGNLCRTRNCGTDAEKIYDRIQESGLALKVIGFSSGEISAPVDFNVPKMQMHSLPEAIAGVLANDCAA